MLAAVEHGAGGLLAEPLEGLRLTGFVEHPLAPLLEEERDAGARALVAQATDPVGMRWPCARARFAAGDDPVETVKVRAREVDRSEQRLSGNEPLGRRRHRQVRNALLGLDLALGRDAQPDVGSGHTRPVTSR